jgi:ribose transport system ATP-binding protein
LANQSLVKMNNISMEFPGVKALDDVDFDLKKGEVHVLLGENGAGKSTLMKILCGVYKKKSGYIELKGKKVDIKDVHQAQGLGISIIYQELNLIPYLTVAENIFIGRQPMHNGMVHWNKMYEDAAVILKKLNVDIDPRTKVLNLGIAQQQMVEVAKATSVNADVLIMDEPTSALTEKEIKELFRTMHALKKSGVGIIYISHRLDELKQVGDRATVLRDGKYIDTIEFENGNVDLDQIIKLMVGRDLVSKFPPKDTVIGEEIFRVENISTKGFLKNCSFNVKSGEILGVAGLMGAGRTELMRAVTGADKKESGDVYIRGEKVIIKNFGDAVDNRIAYLSEDRKGQGLVLIFDVKQNITLANLDNIKKNGLLNLKKEKEDALELVEALNIKTPSIGQKVKNLSGGNQQKVVVAKWLYTECDILIFDEPTRGIDVGAKVEIYKLMLELAKEGKAIIMISSELPEVLGMSDRIVVMHEGEISGELSIEEADQVKILYLATGGE